MNAIARKLDDGRATFSRMFRRLAFLPPLITRITVGTLFVISGLRKFDDLGQATQSFEKLHIPAPAFNASLVASCELICGALLILGLLSRLATIPLMVTMIVAIATAKAKDIHSVAVLFGLAEFCLLLLLFTIAVN